MPTPDPSEAKERPCGHPLPDPLEREELSCSRYRCRRRVVACVTYVGVGFGEQPSWRIDPTCKKHLRLLEQTARRARHADHPGVFRHRSNLAKILDWLHDDERCAVRQISLTSHRD